MQCDDQRTLKLHCYKAEALKNSHIYDCLWGFASQSFIYSFASWLQDNKLGPYSFGFYHTYIPSQKWNVVENWNNSQSNENWKKLNLFEIFRTLIFKQIEKIVYQRIRWSIYFWYYNNSVIFLIRIFQNFLQFKKKNNIKTYPKFVKFHSFFQIVNFFQIHVNSEKLTTTF